MTSKIVGIDGAPVTPEALKPTPRLYAIEDGINVDPFAVTGVLGVNPLFLYIADENGDIKYLVTLDKLVRAIRKD